MCNNPRCQHESPEQTRDTLLTRIDRNGWTSMGVLPGPTGEVPFTYTVGLTLQDLPELLIEGEPTANYPLLADLVELLQDDPDLFSGGEHVEVTSEGCHVQVQLLGPTKANYKRAVWARSLYSATRKVRVLQAVPVGP
jgi:hypothetical protein